MLPPSNSQRSKPSCALASLDASSSEPFESTLEPGDSSAPVLIADLNRIASKTKNAAQLVKINQYRQIVRVDGEVLLRGAVPASAIKGAGSMALTRGLQGVQIVGFVMTAVDLGSAVDQSVRTSSVKPIAAETIRQVGGWAAAWAGVKIGSAAGAAIGIETGPGAVVTGAAGAVVGGVAGYCGFDWVADHVWEN